MSDWGWFRALLACVFVVGITAAPSGARPGERPEIPEGDRVGVAAIAPQGGTTGSHRRIVLLCAFPDGTSPSTKPLAYYQTMYDEPGRGLLAFYDEASYGRIKMSAAFRDWVPLPESQSAYNNDSAKLFADCTAGHDASVDFSNFDAIDIIANDRIGDAQLGGTHCPTGTLDGIDRCWPTTWIASQDGEGADSRALWAHEMGHSLNLPHTTGTDGAHYWDPMGAPGLWCWLHNKGDEYECTPTHYLAAHKDRKMVDGPFGKTPVGLGWIGKGRRFIAKKGDTATIKLERLAKPRDNGRPLIARIPVPGKPFYYTVEARVRVGQFDSPDNLPGSGVIVSYVDWRPCFSCVDYMPVQVVGKDKDNDSLMEPGSALWKPGETFRAKNHGVKVAVLSKTKNFGFRVRITLEG